MEGGGKVSMGSYLAIVFGCLAAAAVSGLIAAKAARERRENERLFRARVRHWRHGRLEE